MKLKAPFPWFGGKSRVSHIVWERFGNPPNYVEPFAGSLAVLLGRPTKEKTETVNDKDCYVANFWRALQDDPEGVAKWADAPVNEADLHARHKWLIEQAGFREAMLNDPHYYDSKIAGWWVWGLSCWIGGGWCGSASKKMPHIGSNIGRGVHRQLESLTDYMLSLRNRLRYVRVCCGDWSRICNPAMMFSLGTTAVFLDPPYSGDAGRDNNVYREEDLSVSVVVREWCISNGENPELRIALCGYEGEHILPDDWDCVQWKATGGYALQGKKGEVNRHRERIWFSPHCLHPGGLFEFGGDSDG